MPTEKLSVVKQDRALIGMGCVLRLTGCFLRVREMSDRDAIKLRVANEFGNSDGELILCDSIIQLV